MLNQIILNIASGEIGGTQSQNLIAFSLLPFLTPDELTENHQKTRILKKLRKPVMYDIEQMPDKIEVSFETGFKQDQAFLGDPYCLKMQFKQKEEVTIKSLKVVVLDIIS